MKSVYTFGLLALVVAATPVLASVPFPAGDNIALKNSKRVLRPVVQDYRIAWGDFAFADINNTWVVGHINLYNTQDNSLLVLGKAGGSPAGAVVADELAWVAGWAPWTPQIGFEGDYIGYNEPITNGGIVYQISTGTFTHMDNPGEQWHFADVNANGILAIQDWDPFATVNVIDPGTFDGSDGSMVFRSANASTEFGTAPRMSGDTVAYNDDTASDYRRTMYDIGTNTESVIWTSPKANDLYPQKIQVDSTGNKLVLAVRDEASDDGFGGKLTQVIVYDVTAGTWSTLLNFEEGDEEPMLDGDYLVWQRKVGVGNNDIFGMYIPSGQVFHIAQGAANAQYPWVDGDTGLVAWIEPDGSGEDYAFDVHYTFLPAYVPEPASLGLLALGGLALLRRR
ncbi:MAG: PEP-CTERM sorting domain-containing protein [Phycisphaeraceae bacterium]|nr:PEP-CTERM sorting domain-containing protein [Phycisphaeraceae bacterium]